MFYDLSDRGYCEPGDLRFANNDQLFVFYDAELTPPVMFKVPEGEAIILIRYASYYYTWKVLTSHGVGFVSMQELQEHSSPW